MFNLIGVAGDVVGSTGIGGGYGAHSGLGNVDHARPQIRPRLGKEATTTRTSGQEAELTKIVGR
ncbi:hypothetical protein [Nonomuraea sp. NPDC052265]|uniref:hypothetical protein n=1 Tax=Nonomuraea sp. NPDC052265 TaxID=3364374 RepID=UPI0037C4FEFA